MRGEERRERGENLKYLKRDSLGDGRRRGVRTLCTCLLFNAVQIAWDAPPRPMAPWAVHGAVDLCVRHQGGHCAVLRRLYRSLNC